MSSLPFVSRRGASIVGAVFFLTVLTLQSGRAQVTLPSAPRKIQISKTGFEIWQGEITPQPGLPQRIDARLLTPREAILARIPQVVKI